VVDSTNNRVGILDATPAVTLDIGSATDAIFVPSGTTAQRPTGANGYFRYNTDDAQFEGYADGAWGAIAGSGGGGSAMEQQILSGDGSTTGFTLTSAPTSENNLLVFVDGVFQAQDTYSVSGTTLTFSTAPANGRVITVYHILSSISGSNMIVDSMTGDGSDVTLTLSVAPVSENNVQVYIDGVYQSKSNYSISGTTLTFTTAPPSGTAVEAITHTQTSINTPANGSVAPASIASGDFYFDTDTLYIDATNNRVGIGTSSPSGKLTVDETSTGQIIQLSLNGTEIGNLGTVGSDMYVGTGDTTLRFHDSDDDIRPASTTGSARDNAIDLGHSGAAFKDLYLGSGIYLTGTAAANYLDDYEEGTWTPTITGVSGGSGQTYSTQTGKYLKIGDLVVLSFQVTFSNKGSMTGIPVLGGIPFASGTTGAINRAMNLVWGDLAISPYSIGYLPRGSGFAQFYLSKLTAAGNISLFASGSGDFNNNSTIAGTITYRVSV